MVTNNHLARLLPVWKWKLLSHVWLFASPWTVAHQAPLSTEFSRQEYCSGLPFPSPGDLPDTGIEPRSPALQADALPSELPRKPVCWRPKSRLLDLARCTIHSASPTHPHIPGNRSHWEVHMAVSCHEICCFISTWVSQLELNFFPCPPETLVFSRPRLSVPPSLKPT